jgi:transforming growth factor-beta-induced protein
MLHMPRSATYLSVLTLALGLTACPAANDDDSASDDDDSVSDDDDSVGDDDDSVGDDDDSVGDDDDSVGPTDSIYDIASGSDDFETLTAAIDAAGLTATLDDDDGAALTVFAPTDAAFDALPAGLLGKLLADTDLLTSILTYHVVSGAVTSETVVTLNSATTLQGEDVTIVVDGTTVTVNGATVTAVDIEATNGIIHVIDAVIVPPSVDLPVDIVDTAINAGTFTTLAQALIDTGLVDTLRSEGPYTVFAPTDAAFAEIADTVASLTTEQLTDILLYHVVSGEVDAATVVGLSSATTVNGADISIDASNGVVLNGTANVVTTDVIASNGIIHVIDEVLLPPTE